MKQLELEQSQSESRPHVQILDLNVDRVDMNTVLDIVEGYIQDGQAHHIMTASIRFLSLAAKDEKFEEIAKSADLTVADGMPLIWLSKIMAGPVPERITGPDLVYRLSEYAAEKGYSVFLLGGKPGLVEETALKLTSLYPRLKIAGTHHGYFTPENEHFITDYIRETQPHFLFAGLGSPKQDFWIHQWKDELKIPVSIGIGGTFEVITGRLKRAPIWMQRGGLEWFYRLKQEPRRLWRRYVLEDVPTTIKAAGYACGRGISVRIRQG